MSDETSHRWTAPPIRPGDPQHADIVRRQIDAKAKPPGSLGRIEDLAALLGAIWHPAPPRTEQAVLLVFAADHGLTQEGVSQYPSSVTAAMVATYLAGRATANAFAAATGVTVKVIDAGVAQDLPPHSDLIREKIRLGTANAAREPAMTSDEAIDSLTRGCRIAIDTIDRGADIIALGEMGIGNTAASALIVHRLAQAPLDDCIGIGAGQDDAGMMRKRAALKKAASRSDTADPLGVLTQFGGLEIGMMAGAILGAASKRRPVVVDGFISTAAALLAVRLCPAARDYCVFAHRSAEKGHDIALAALSARPLLDLGMRLGEGTGALLAIPLLRAAGRLLTNVADLSDVLAGTI